MGEKPFNKRKLLKNYTPEIRSKSLEVATNFL